MALQESRIGVALYVSGGGTTAESVLRECYEPYGRLNGRINPLVVVASNPDAGALKKVAALEKYYNITIPTEVLDRRDYPNLDAFGTGMMEAQDKYGVDVNAYLGWTRMVPSKAVRLSFNQHPAPLDPGAFYIGSDGLSRPKSFGGKKMMGATAVAATLAYSWGTGAIDKTEATTHYITEDEKYDRGDLIRTEAVSLPLALRPWTIDEMEEDPSVVVNTANNFHKNTLLPVEHHNVIETFVLFHQAGGRVEGHRRETPLIADGTEHILFRARDLAIKHAA